MVSLMKLEDQIKVLDEVLQSMKPAKESSLPIISLAPYLKRNIGGVVIVEFDSRKYQNFNWDIWRINDNTHYFCITINDRFYDLSVMITEKYSEDYSLYIRYNLIDMRFYVGERYRDDDNKISFDEKPNKEDLFNLSLGYDKVHEAFEILDIAIKNKDMFVRDLKG